MAEKIVIAELDIDTNALIKSTKELKSNIDALKQSQKELTKEGETASEEYIQNAADLKVLTSAYNSNIKAISDSTQAKADEANRTELLNLALQTEVTSIKEAREQNSLLNRLRNEANATTTEGQAEITKLNNALDANNEFIKENADSYLKQKINIGNYSESIKEAFNDLNIFNGGITGFIGRAQSAGGVTKLLSGAIKSVTVSIGGMIKASLAFIATPIGAVITAVGLVLATLVNYLRSTQDGIDTITSVTRPMMAIFESLIGVFQDVGRFLIKAFTEPKEALSGMYDYVKDKLIKQFEGLYDLLVGIITLDFEQAGKGLDTLGDNMKDVANDVKEAGKEAVDFLSEAYKKGQEIDKLTKEIEKAESKVNLQRQIALSKIKDLDKIAKDTSLTTEKRLKANEKQNELAREQAKIEDDILVKKIKRLEIEQSLNDSGREDNKETNELLAQRENIVQKVLDEELKGIRVISQARKEDEANAQKAIQSRIDKQVEELALLTEKMRFSEGGLSTLQTLADEEIKILDNKLKSRLISETAYETEKLKIENSLQEARKAKKDKELEDIQIFEDKKKELTDAIRLRNTESDREKELIALELKFEKDSLELEKLVEDETQRTELLALLTEERELVLQEIKQRFSEENLELFRQSLEAQNNAQKVAGDAQIAIARNVTGTLTGILGDGIGARLASIAVDAALQVAQIQSTSATSQAINLAQASAVAPPPLNVPFLVQAGLQNATVASNAQIQTAKVLKASALSGFKAVASKIKFEKGGIQEIGGKSHTAGGTKFYGEDGTAFEAQKGEGIGILNRQAYSAFMDFNNRFGSGNSSSGFFQGGGIITQGVRTESQNLDAVIEALQNQPPPIVSVEEIQRVGSQLVSVKNMANLG
jgi:hypothetical protein